MHLASCEFTTARHTGVLVGAPGTGKSHLAIAIGVAGITEHGKRVHFYSTVDLVNALEREKTEGSFTAKAAARGLCRGSRPSFKHLLPCRNPSQVNKAGSTSNAPASAARETHPGRRVAHDVQATRCAFPAKACGADRPAARSILRRPRS